MKSGYTKTKWIDGTTPVCATYLNKLEEAVQGLYDKALEEGMIGEGDGIVVSYEDGELNVSVDSTVLRSTTLGGIEIITEEPEEWKTGKLYLMLDPDTKELKEIWLGGIVIFKN